MKEKRRPQIGTNKRRTQRIIKPKFGPSESLGGLGPNLEQMVLKPCREFDSERNIFEVEAENDKHERPVVEEYHVTFRAIRSFRIVVDDA